MRIAVGTDHRGYPVRGKIVDLLQHLGHDVEDMGTSPTRPWITPTWRHRVARRSAAARPIGAFSICGTGMGMCIAANKFPGVRAAPCHDDLTAEMSRRHNDSNVLCLSADLLGERLIGRMIELWLTTPFEGGRHARRIEKITAIEARNRRALSDRRHSRSTAGPGTLDPPKCPSARAGFLPENCHVPAIAAAISLRNATTYRAAQESPLGDSCWCGCSVRSGPQGKETTREGRFAHVRALESPHP